MSKLFKKKDVVKAFKKKKYVDTKVGDLLLVPVKDIEQPWCAVVLDKTPPNAITIYTEELGIETMSKQDFEDEKWIPELLLKPTLKNTPQKL